jgi:general secretion pathway protein A
MYEAYYGFTEKPFNLTPDPKYLYQSRRHTEAAAHLEFGRRERGGFILITGEVGTGKTTLARHFLGRLPDGTATAVVLYPALTAAELLKSILDDLHAPAEGVSLKDLVDSLHRFLLQSRAEGRNVVLLIDEAQDLSPEVLEQVRLISNLETDTEKLIQIVLIGQSELLEMLARRELRQLAQRVTARYHLAPLSPRETADYVRHRLAVAGGAGKVSFTPRALAAIHHYAGGIPRLINLVCDRALLAGYVRGTRVIEADMARQAAAEVSGEPGTGPALGRYAAAIVAALVLVGLVYALAFPRPLSAPAPVQDRIPASPPGVTVAKPTPSAEPTPVVPGRFETLMGTLSRDASYRAATARLESLWGGPPLERTALRTHLPQVRRLDMPAVLEMFLPARSDTCFVALLSLDHATALVGVGDEAPFRVALSDVDQFWTRDAVFFWRDFDALGHETTPARSTWARGQLERLGYTGAGADLKGAVGQFQRESDLVVDGVIGSRTLMALYSRGAWPRPRLSAKTAAAGGAS